MSDHDPDHDRFTAPPDLVTELFRLLQQVPEGSVTTYGDLAEALGDRRASRWVGAELLHHSHSATCLCHRVVRANGDLGVYRTGDVHDKLAELEREHVNCPSLRVDLDRYRFASFRGHRPLQALRDLQMQLVARLSQDDPPCTRRIAGIDVSYRHNTGMAAYVEVDRATGGVVWQATFAKEVTFPYIPTFLSFRELPVLIPLIEKVRREHVLADIVMVDGSGILHPNRAGIASMLGVAADVPTIGVTKRSLCGQVNLRPLRFGRPGAVTDPATDEILGEAMLPTASTCKPIYVSPGHRVSVNLASHIAQSFLGRGRLPAPIYWADRISRYGLDRWKSA